ncbi:hypothetical protein JKF63_01319 [Porcisia hertigi]|uniref:Uncharacterized protein n=1 Tax=Porcisia hertigi TaxID=2761500 RepID=A0A836KZI5_9TRYP|nr:hypothetical protein JKF63_01319 [Porcisia hertigi]
MTSASSPQSPAPPPSPPPPHRFSAEAAPFVPSYMRSPDIPASVTLSVPAPLDASNAAGEGNDDIRVNEANSLRQHFSKVWMCCLQQMQGDEVGMLMDMMPPDIQDIYSDKLSDEYLLHEHEHKDQGARAMRAAQKMVQELTPEQLVHIEEFLLETDALNPDVQRCFGDGDDSGDIGTKDGNGDLFLNHDDGMDSDEEEWLLEQIMAPSDPASTDAK